MEDLLLQLKDYGPLGLLAAGALLYILKVAIPQAQKQADFIQGLVTQSQLSHEKIVAEFRADMADQRKEFLGALAEQRAAIERLTDAVERDQAAREARRA